MPIITISRGSMSGGKEIGECISGASRPCRAFGREVLVDAAAKAGRARASSGKENGKGSGFVGSADVGTTHLCRRGSSRPSPNTS